MKSRVTGLSWVLLLLLAAPACSPRARDARIVDTTTSVDMSQEFIKRIAVARPSGRVNATRAIECLAEVAPGATSELSTRAGPLSPNIPDTHYGITRSGLVTTWRSPEAPTRPPPCAPCECLTCLWSAVPKDGERPVVSSGEPMTHGPC